MYKTPLNTNAGRAIPRFLKTPLPALSKGLFEASSPPSHADPPLFAHTRTISAAITVPGSAMRGVVMTTTGQPLVTPAPADILRRLARPLRPQTLEFGHVKEDAAEVEDALTRNVEDATPQPIEKRSSIVGVSALRPKPSKDRVDVAPLLRRAKTSAPSTSARAGPSSPRKTRERSVSPNPTYDRVHRASAELKRSPSTTDVKKPERLMVRTTTAPTVPTTSSIRSGRPSASGLQKKTREQASASSPKSTKPDAPVSSSSSSSMQPSGLSASDSSATSAEPDTGDTAVPPFKDKGGSKKSRRNTGISPVPEEAPVYDLDDEDNLPSPFLKRVDRDRFAVAATNGSGSTASSRAKATGPTLLQPAPTIATKGKATTVGTAAGRRLSGATLLRVVAAKNATRAPSPGRPEENVMTKKTDFQPERPAITSARRATEEARQRPQRV
jgi:NIMA (never in mitosis gene a)-related kinase 2